VNFFSASVVSVQWSGGRAECDISTSSVDCGLPG